MRRAALTLALAALLAPLAAGAHTRGSSYSDWRVAKDGAEVRVRVSQLELTRLQLDPAATPGYGARVGEMLRENLQLWSDSSRCAASPAKAVAGEDGWVTAEWSLSCASASRLTLRTTLFLDVAPSHLHFARVQFGDGAAFERVLTYGEPAVTLEAPPLSTSFGHYLRLGIGHILSGWDHMAFVLALILLAASVREVALVATGFTVAHSLTLAAAVLGWADPQAAAIESLIGFSIAIVAAENLWLAMGRERWVPVTFVVALLALAVLGATPMPGSVLMGLALFTASYFALARTSAAGVIEKTYRSPAFAHGASKPVRLRIAVAFVFGLVHGFGFAGALTPLALPQDRLAVGLLGFNSGVEAGQLLVIAAVWPALKVLERAPVARRWAGDLASAGIAALGVFWFLTRAFGGIA